MAQEYEGGLPEYTPPEKINGKYEGRAKGCHSSDVSITPLGGVTTKAVDIFGLGCTFWEAYSRKRFTKGFDRESYAQSLNAALAAIRCRLYEPEPHSEVSACDLRTMQGSNPPIKGLDHPSDRDVY